MIDLIKNDSFITEAENPLSRKKSEPGISRGMGGFLDILRSSIKSDMGYRVSGPLEENRSAVKYDDPYKNDGMSKSEKEITRRSESESYSVKNDQRDRVGGADFNEAGNEPLANDISVKDRVDSDDKKTESLKSVKKDVEDENRVKPGQLDIIKSRLLKIKESLAESGISSEKEGFTEGSELKELYARISHLIDEIINKLNDSHKKGNGPEEFKFDDITIPNKKGSIESKSLERLIKGLKALMDNIERIDPEKEADLKRLLTRLESMSEMISAAGKESRKKGHPKITGDESEQLKSDNTLNKSETNLVKGDASKGEGLKNNSGNDHTGNNSGFNYASFKSNGRVSESGSLMRNPKNVEFRSQLHSIIESSKVVVKDGKNASFSVRLRPKELGSINVNIGLSRGVITGKFFVESMETKELLMHNLNYIREQLEEAGIEVGGFQVNINNRRDMYNKEDPEFSDNIFTGIENLSMINEYDLNSIAVHDGELNVVI